MPLLKVFLLRVNSLEYYADEEGGSATELLGVLGLGVLLLGGLGLGVLVVKVLLLGLRPTT